jgi:transposase
MFEDYKTIVVMDHHKRFSVYQVVDLSTGEVSLGRVDATRPAMRKWLASLRLPARLYVEACRGWEWVSDLCDELKIECRLVNPTLMPEIWKSPKKTDRTDVKAMLTRLFASGSLPESYRATPSERELRSLTRARMDLKRVRRQMMNRIHAICDSHGLSSMGSDFRDSAWRKSMQRELSSGFAGVLGIWLDLLQNIDEQLVGLDLRIGRLTQRRSDVRKLRKIPGIGPIIAATLVAEIGRMDRFDSSRKFAAYCGLVPRVRSSASTTRLGRISKAGPPGLRWALTQAIVCGLKVRGNPFARFCRRKRRRGEGAMRSVCAAAHKLARVIYSILSRNQAYNPRRVGQPA